MIIDFKAHIKDIKGNDITDGKEIMTLESVVCNVLLGSFPDEQNLDARIKVQRFKLAEKIVESNGGGIDLSVEEVADLKKLIGKAFPPLVVGRAYQILDPERDNGKSD